MNVHHVMAHARTWRRNRKKLKRLQNSEVVLLRYPKSGVTWLRVMITNIYRCRFGEAGSEIVGRSAFHARCDRVPNMFVCMDNFGLSRQELNKRLESKKVILLLRDPRDVVISHYFSFSKRATPVERIVNGVPDSVEADGPYKFAVHPEFGMPRIINFMNYWFTAVRNHQATLIVRYEDLRRNTIDAFTPVMKALLPDVTREEIEGAVAASEFDRMKKMEAEGSFGLDILKPRSKNEGDSYKVRRGKIGGYADYLSANEKEVLDRMVAETINPEIGYS
jgi:hypothetical protein